MPRTQLRLASLAVGAAMALSLAPIVPASAATPSPYFVGGYIAPTTRLDAADVLASRHRLDGIRAVETLPESVDLRDDAPPVGNQGQIGSCVSWTIGHAIMGYWANKSQGTGAPYSPLYLYMRTVQKGKAPSGGTSPDYALALASSSGVDTEDDYWQGWYGYQTAPTAAEIANAGQYKISSYSRLWAYAGQTSAAKTLVEESLAAGNPVAIGFPVFRSFRALNSDALYTDTSGTVLGGHMVAVFGYDADGVWIRNSWSTRWGASGDAHLSWDFVTKVVDAAYSVGGITTPATATPAPPSIVAMSNRAGGKSGGQTLTLTGSGLGAATAVTFGTDPAQFTAAPVNGTSVLTVTTPAHAVGNVDVTVTTPSGTSAVTSNTRYTYTPDAPAITAISRTSTPTTGGDVLVITGTDLAKAKSVSVDGKAVSPKVLSDYTLQFKTPKHAAGTVAVKVTTPYGTSGTLSLGYATPAAPQVGGLNPDSGSAIATTALTVTGNGLLQASKVLVDGKAVGFTKVNDTTLTLKAPKHAAGTGHVQVVYSGGTTSAESDDTFTWETPDKPEVDELSATTGPNWKKSTITVRGKFFTGTTHVQVGALQASFKYVDDTTLTVTLPPANGTQDEHVQVQTALGWSEVESDDKYSYVRPEAPTVTALSQAQFYAATGGTTTLTGTDLASTKSVLLNGQAIAFKVLSDTQVKVTLPKRPASTYTLQVVTAGGITDGATVSFE